MLNGQMRINAISDPFHDG